MPDQNAILLNELRAARRAGELVIFVGAGLSAGSGLPDWYALTAELAGQIGADMPPRQWAGGDTLIGIIQDYVNSRGKASLIRFLQDRLDTTNHPPTLVHALLARSGVDLVFTANYDDLLEEAFKDARIQRRPVITDEDIPLMRRGGKVVSLVKLYGDLDQPKTVVLDRESYERFFLDRPQMIKLLETELGRSTMLYLGWSHRDPHFNLLFGQLLNRFGQMMRPGYAVMFGVKEAERAELRRKGIHVIDLPATGDLTATLAAWLSELLEDSLPSGVPTPANTAAPDALSGPGTTTTPSPPIASGAPADLTPQDLQIIRDILAGYSEFDSVGNRDTLLQMVGLKQIAGRVDLSGARHDAAGRLVVFLAALGDGAQPPTPLGNLLRYLAATPTLPPAKRATLQVYIDRCRL
jgi:hypothetical protein